MSASSPTEPDSQAVLLSANSGWNLTNYRLGLIWTLTEAGYEVHLAVPSGPETMTLAGVGAQVHDLPMAPRGTSPIEDAILLARYIRLMRRAKPTAYLGFTIKPNIYGSLAARMCGVRTINNISGLGALFSRRTALTAFVIPLYRLALARSRTVFFQNRDDAELFATERLVRPSQVRLIPGSGIDLAQFTFAAEPESGPITFLLAARLLWDKGIREFVEAANAVRQSHPGTRFQILGFIEPPGSSAVPKEILDGWNADGSIEFLGSSADVRPNIAQAHCIVLPSLYREGVPRILLEAAASGRPVITTDTPGCRDAVEHGATGFLCEPKSVTSLIHAMRQFVELTAVERRAMGKLGRLKMQREFDQRIVHEAYLQALSE